MSFDLKNSILAAIAVFLGVHLMSSVSQNEALCGESQQIQLLPPLKEGSCYQVRTVLRARGFVLLKSPTDSKETRVPMEVHGTLGYHERILGQQPLRSARHYHETQAKVTVGGRTQQLALPKDQRLVGCRLSDGRIELTSVDHPLTGSEQDLINLQGNSLLLSRLVPAQVRRHQKWMIDKEVAGALVGIDTPVDCTLSAQLVSANSRAAIIELAGEVIGGVEGVRADIEISGKLTIDIPARSIKSLSLEIRERRAISDGQPGLDVTAELYSEVEPTEIPDELRADRIAVLMDEESGRGQPLRFKSDDLGVSLLYTPQWKVVLHRYDVAVLRQLDDGELLANMTINSLPNAPPKKHLAMASFQTEIEKALAERNGQMLEATEATNDDGLRILRITAAGAVEKVSLYWVYYHISNDKGRRASVVVTVESDNVERYAEAERSLIASWQFISRTDRPEKTATKVEKKR